MLFTLPSLYAYLAMKSSVISAANNPFIGFGSYLQQSFTSVSQKCSELTSTFHRYYKLMSLFLLYATHTYTHSFYSTFYLQYIFQYNAFNI